MPTQRRAYLKRILPVVWPFVLVISCLLPLQWICLDILAAGRAYIGSEGMWSKGQKDAVYYLERYAATQDETAYQAYRQAINVPLSAERALHALEQPTPDLQAAHDGLLAGGNSEADIPGMIRLYRWFQHTGFVRDAIVAWSQANVHIARLDQLAQELHALATQPVDQTRRIARIRAEIQQINAFLTPLERNFSLSIAQELRQTRFRMVCLYLFAMICLIALAIRHIAKLLRQRSESEEALRISEDRFQLAVTGSTDGIWDWNLRTGYVWSSPRLYQMLGITPQELPPWIDAWLERVHPEDRGMTLGSSQKLFKRGEFYDAEYRVRIGPAGGNTYRWFRLRGQAVFVGSEETATRMAGSLSDITNRKEAEAALHHEKEKAQITLASIGDAVIATDISGRVEYMNPAAEKMALMPQDQAIGQALDQLFKVLDPELDDAAISLLGEICVAENSSLGRDVTLVRHDGTEISINWTASPIHDRRSNVTGTVLVLHDVTQERRYADSLSWQASHDELTGLLNRREFERRLSALHARPGQHLAHALMLMDLDQFKIVNDTSGHAAGDELLRQIGIVLQQHLRQSDSLARTGADEFGVLLENCSIEAAMRIGETLRQSVKDFLFSYGEQSFSIGMSVGLVEIADTAMTPEEVLRAADAACYMAKEKGRNRVQRYFPQDSEVTLRHGEMEWVNRLQRALEKNQFRLYAQEISPLKPDEEGRHVEILLRLLDEQGQIVPPMAFIPAAERYNLMPEIDRWVLRNTLATISARDRAGREPLAICAINLSGASIGDEHFLAYALEQVQQSGVEPSRLCFEITETSAIASLSRATHFMQQLSALGCKFSLDDFGSGMSSFGYLKHLPVDYLKIDGGFVKDMLSDPIDRAMVGAINEIGHLMGKKTIAEFVADEAIADTLREMGVDFAQGYGIARPEPFQLEHSDVVPA